MITTQPPRCDKGHFLPRTTWTSLGPDDWDDTCHCTIQDKTPCSIPECADEPCTRHEREQAHADGEHFLYGQECRVGEEEA